MRLAQNLAEIGNLAAFPQQGDRCLIVEPGAQGGLAGQRREGTEVFRFARRREIARRGRQSETLDQRVDRIERQLRIAPEDEGQRIERVGLDRLDQVGVEFAGVGGRAECAVLHVPARPPGDLPDLRRGQPPPHAPVELDQIGKGDVVHIHVQAHAYGVGGDQVVDIAGLEHLDLGVARPGAQRAEHHRRAAAPPPDHLGERIDFLGREGDRSGPGRQAGDLLRAGIGEPGKARPGDELGFGHQPVQDRPDGLGADQHGLDRSARPEDPVGKDIAALGIGCELDLVDRQELDLAVDRHGLDRTEKKARGRRNDLFFARDQRHRMAAGGAHRPVVVLPGKQAQREADHAGAVRQHAFHREMRLAGVGRPEDGCNAPARTAGDVEIRPHGTHGRPGSIGRQGERRWRMAQKRRNDRALESPAATRRRGYFNSAQAAPTIRPPSGR